jgi:hypothetical protein
MSESMKIRSSCPKSLWKVKIASTIWVLEQQVHPTSYTKARRNILGAWWFYIWWIVSVCKMQQNNFIVRTSQNLISQWDLGQVSRFERLQANTIRRRDDVKSKESIMAVDRVESYFIRRSSSMSQVHNNSV